MRFSKEGVTMSFLRRRRSRLRLFSCIMWLRPDLLRRTRPVPVKLNRLAAARFVFIFGMTSCSARAYRSRRPLSDHRRAVHAAGMRGAGVMADVSHPVKPADAQRADRGITG